jgi:hypothetical protein
MLVSMVRVLIELLGVLGLQVYKSGKTSKSTLKLSQLALEVGRLKGL